MTHQTFRFSGFGGQGVLLMGVVLTHAGMEEGKHVTWLPSYGAEMRGGTANCTVVISDEEIASPVIQNPDVAIVMNNPSLSKFEPLVRKGGLLFINSSLVTSETTRSDIKIIKIPATDLANELSNNRVANMVMLGAVAARTAVVPLQAIKDSFLPVIGENKAKLIPINHQAIDRGSSLV